MRIVLQDVRYGLRMLWKTPGLLVLVVLSLALGIGANSAIFSTINTLMLRNLPVRDPQSLYLLRWFAKSDNLDAFVHDIEGDESKDARTGGPTSYSVSYPVYQRIQQNNNVFSDTFAFAANEDQVNVGLGKVASSAIIQGVSGNLFGGVGVSPVIGRAIMPADDDPAAAPVAVVSYAFWNTRMGGDAGVLGKTISMNGIPLTVIGVAPAEFFGLNPGVAPDLWVPLSLYAQEWQRTNGTNGTDDTTPIRAADTTWWLGVVGRLKPGVSTSQATAELDALFNQSLRAYNPKLPANSDIPKLEVHSLAKGLNSLREEFSKSLFLLMGMVGLVLLIACANVAGLLMARAASRQREIALRLSLGASKARILGQLLTESVMLGICGGAVALLVAHWASHLLVALLDSGRDQVPITLHLDGRVLAFTAVVSVVSGIIFGLAPSLAAMRVQPLTTLKQNSANATMGSKRFRSGKILVGAQVALSLLLLVSAGLLLRTLQVLQHVNLGFDRQSVVLFTVRPGLNGYSREKLIFYYQEVARQVKTIPGVRSAAFAQRNPIGQGATITSVTIPGYTTSEKGVEAYRLIVGPEYFETMRIPVLMGRSLGEQDTSASRQVAMVNRAFAAKYLHGDNPLGHELEFGRHTNPVLMEIVGVVQDVKYEHIREEPPPTLYVPYTQTRDISPYMTYELRISGDKDAVIQGVNRVAQLVDPNVPVVNIHTEEEVVQQVLYLERTFALLSSAFGALALILACIGIYGTIAYTVSQRTNEIGIRMALGAERVNILKMVLRETLVVVAAGLLAGLPLAWLCTRLLSGQVYGLSPHDPVTLIVAVVSIGAVTVAAGFIPAQRASRVDPMQALRSE